MTDAESEININKILAEAAKSVGTDAYNKLKERFLDK